MQKSDNEPTRHGRASSSAPIAAIKYWLASAEGLARLRRGRGTRCGKLEGPNREPIEKDAVFREPATIRALAALPGELRLLVD
jgi:hypothetical protein